MKHKKICPLKKGKAGNGVKKSFIALITPIMN